MVNNITARALQQASQESQVLPIFAQDDITVSGKIIVRVCSRAISFDFEPTLVASRNSVTRGSSLHVDLLSRSAHLRHG